MKAFGTNGILAPAPSKIENIVTSNLSPLSGPVMYDPSTCTEPAEPSQENHCSEADESSDEEKAIRLDESAVGGEEEDGVEHEPNAAVCTFARNSPSACVL